MLDINEQPPVCTPKRRCFHPRYMNEIKSPDLATPKRAKRSLFLARNIIKNQAFKIKILKQKNRRLEKKITSLQDLVQHLKRQNLISEDAGNTSTVCLSFIN